jgi:cysteinyl-tRNA synthetase
MSIEYLGETFDIHGGGKDLIFPHHENEIAQSEGAFEKPFVNYWIHNGFVNINKEKMSKSLGNFIMINYIIKKYNPESVRLFLLSNHYRSPIDFTEQALFEASSGLDKIYSLLDRVEKQIGNRSDNDAIPQNAFWEQFCLAMDDDFNTALGIGILFDAVRNINRLLDDNKNLSKDVIKTVLSYRADICKMAGILGIITKSPEAYFAEKKSRGLEEKSIDPEMIETMIKERVTARKLKDWSKADNIRKQLEDMNIIIEDSSDGTVWKVKD